MISTAIHAMAPGSDSSANTQIHTVFRPVRTQWMISTTCRTRARMKIGLIWRGKAYGVAATERKRHACMVIFWSMRLTALILGGLLLAGVARSQPPESAPQDAAVPRAPLRIGLVLSGGGARGMAHVGVLKVLDDMHVHVDAIAGTSMGAVVGGLYASGMSG